MSRTSKGLRASGALAATGLVAAAVVTEMRKPSTRRSGTGTVAGVVPYDFRKPTAERIKNAVWAPDDTRVVKPHAFGVGWSVNVGRLATLAVKPFRR